MADRKITSQALAVALGVHRNTVMALRSDYPTMIRLTHLDQICQLLNCQPGDLLEYHSDEAEAQLESQLRGRVFIPK